MVFSDKVETTESTVLVLLLKILPVKLSECLVFEHYQLSNNLYDVCFFSLNPLLATKITEMTPSAYVVVYLQGSVFI